MAKQVKTKEEIQQEKLRKELSDLKAKDRLEFLTVDKENKISFDKNKVFKEKFGWVIDENSNLRKAISETKIKNLKNCGVQIKKHLYGSIKTLRDYLEQATHKLNLVNDERESTPIVGSAGRNISKLQKYRVSVKNQVSTLTEQIEKLKQDIADKEKECKSTTDKEAKKVNAKALADSKKVLKDALACKKKLESLIAPAGKALKKVKSSARHLGVTSIENVNGIASHVSALFDGINMEDLEKTAKSDKVDSNAKKDIQKFQQSIKKAIKETKVRNKQLKTLISGTLDDSGANKATELVEKAYKDIEDSSGLFNYLDALKKKEIKMEVPDTVKSVEEANTESKKAASDINNLGRLAKELSQGMKELPLKMKEYKKKWQKEGISGDIIKLMFIEIAARFSERVNLKNSMDLSTSIENAKASCMVTLTTYAAANVPFAIASFAKEDVAVIVGSVLLDVAGYLSLVAGVITLNPALIVVGGVVIAGGIGLEAGGLSANIKHQEKMEEARRREAELRREIHGDGASSHTASESESVPESPVKQQDEPKKDEPDEQHSAESNNPPAQ